jgi:uncharacterized protein
MSRLQHFLLCCCSVIAFILIPLAGYADDFPAKPNPPRLVNDLANSMSADEVALLEQKLKAFSDSTSNQVTIVTIKSLGSYEVADYTTQLGNKWGIGTKKNNGVLILAAIEDHRVNISVGKGLEGALPDITAGQIINREMRPYFRENHYYQGFDAAVNAIMAATRGEYKAEPKSNQGLPLGNMIVVIIIVLVVLFIISRNGGGGGGRYISGRGSGGFGGGFLAGSIFGSGWGGGGGSSSGGFGGFGGGSFGGGGASGSW